MDYIKCNICGVEKELDVESDVCDGCGCYVCPDCSVGLPENTTDPIDMYICKDCYKNSKNA